mgnify:FL=1
MHIFVTRFNNFTYSENTNYKSRNNIIGCIYGTPIKIGNNILPEEQIIVLEMNNSENIIEGIGILKNKLEYKKHKIYGDNNYNRFIYMSNYYISKHSFTEHEKTTIKNIELLLFKSKKHCKRGQGIQLMPQHIKSITEFDYCKFIENLYKSRFININIKKLLIKDE